MKETMHSRVTACEFLPPQHFQKYNMFSFKPYPYPVNLDFLGLSGHTTRRSHRHSVRSPTASHRLPAAFTRESMDVFQHTVGSTDIRSDVAATTARRSVDPCRNQLHSLLTDIREGLRRDGCGCGGEARRWCAGIEAARYRLGAEANGSGGGGGSSVGRTAQRRCGAGITNSIPGRYLIHVP